LIVATPGYTDIPWSSGPPMIPRWMRCELWSWN